MLPSIFLLQAPSALSVGSAVLTGVSALATGAAGMLAPALGGGGHVLSSLLGALSASPLGPALSGLQRAAAAASAGAVYATPQSAAAAAPSSSPPATAADSQGGSSVREGSTASAFKSDVGRFRDIGSDEVPSASSPSTARQLLDTWQTATTATASTADSDSSADRGRRDLDTVSQAAISQGRTSV